MHPDVCKILSRRSVRAFSDQAIHDQELRDMLKAAMAAPSAGGSDPWHFIVVRSPGMLVRLAEVLPRGQMLARAQVGVVVCGEQYLARRQQLSYMLQDCSAAIENLLLAASFSGLGGCWVGIHPDPARVEGVRHLLGIPQAITPVAGVALGRPDEHHRARTRFSEARLHLEVW